MVRSLLTAHMPACRHKVEVPVGCWEGCLWVRISAQIYNEMAEYEQLADAICKLRTRQQEE